VSVKNLFHNSSRRVRGGAENSALSPDFASSIMLILIMKINMKKESDLLITSDALRPRTEGSMRLCVMKFQRIPIKIMMLGQSSRSLDFAFFTA